MSSLRLCIMHDFTVTTYNDFAISVQDESPPPSPTASHKPLPTPPTPSPSSQTKKGHRPSAPIMPKMKPLTPPKTPRNEISPVQVIKSYW